MDVKAMIREVFVELSSMDSPQGWSETPDRFTPIRRHYIDPFVEEYNSRPRPSQGPARSADGASRLFKTSAHPRASTEKSP